MVWQESIRTFIGSFVQAGLAIIGLFHPFFHFVFEIGRSIYGRMGAEIFLSGVVRTLFIILFVEILSARLFASRFVVFGTAFFLGHCLSDGKGDLIAFFVDGKDFYFYNIVNLYMVVDILNEAVGYLRNVYQTLYFAKGNDGTKGFHTDNLTFYDTAYF